MATATKSFEYSVRDRTGKLVSGKLDAPTEAALVSKLRTMGFAPISVRETNTGMNKELSIPGMGNKVTLKDLAIMSRQFATMINSGLSLLRALSILAEQTESKGLAKVLGEVRNDVETGLSLSAAMAKHSSVFPPLMVNMCRAGEVGGFLDTVLLRIAANYEAEVKLRSKIKSAMTYPVAVLVMAVFAVFGMLIFIVPIFQQMFEDLGGTLPAPTLVLVFLSEQMAWVAPLVVVLTVVTAVVWKRIKNHERVLDVVDPLKLKFPVFGALFQKIAISRFSRNLGTMVSSGVPILQALDIVAETTGNVVIGRAVRDVQASVRGGETLAGPLANHAVFPPMVVQMLAVGEDTGAIDTMLEKISEFYDQEVEAMTESLTALLEPLMIGLLGGVVGSMIIALYMPMFKIFDQIG
jgi:type IV pilus assembly protein PilC